MLQAFLATIRDLATPAVGSPYQRGVIWIAHAMVGAAFVSWFGLVGLFPALALGLAYWATKERGDLRRGGALSDGIEDALGVCMGGLYGLPHWPEAILATGFGIMVLANWKRR
jgi:hypothetical protein